MSAWIIAGPAGLLLALRCFAVAVRTMIDLSDGIGRPSDALSLDAWPDERLHDQNPAGEGR